MARLAQPWFGVGVMVLATTAQAWAQTATAQPANGQPTTQQPATAAFPTAAEPAPAPAPAPAAPAPGAPAVAPAAPQAAPAAYPPAAEPAPPPPQYVEARPEDTSPYRHVSLTFSPIHLLLPVFEMMAEVRLVGKERPLSLALIGGYGEMSKTVTNGFETDTIKAKAYEVGGQLVYYPINNFKSLQVGFEALYINLDAQLQANQSISGNASGLAVGPFAGYKVLTDIGFTFVVQLGADYMAIRANAKDSDTGETAEDSTSRWFPLLNANLGWSF